MSKKVLVVVDVQNDFITGALKNDMALKTVDNIVSKIEKAVEEKTNIVVTRDTHYNENYLNTNEGKHLPIPHCIKNTEGWEIYPKVKAALEKADNSGISVSYVNKESFGSLAVDVYVRRACPEAEIIELVGFCTGICVVSNALLFKANVLDREVYVDASCCACVTEKTHEAALDVLENCHVIVNNRWKEPWK